MRRVRLGPVSVTVLPLLAAVLAGCGTPAAPPSPGPNTGGPVSPGATSTSIPPSPPPLPKPNATPSKTAFVWKLLLDGSDQFVKVVGAPTGSRCAARAFLVQGGHEISGPGLRPKTVSDPSRGVSWTATPAEPLLTLPNPPPAPGQGQAYWQVTCTNPSLQPSSATMKLGFTVA